MAGQPDRIPLSCGVYVISGKALIPALASWGYYDMDGNCHGFVDRQPVLYVGSSSASCSSVRLRLLAHLQGDSRKSTFRQSLGLMLAGDLDLTPVASSCSGGFHFGSGEARLSRWIQGQLSIGVVPHHRPIQAERGLLKSVSPALNIKECERQPFARHLSARRQAIRALAASASAPSLLRARVAFRA